VATVLKFELVCEYMYPRKSILSQRLSMTCVMGRRVRIFPDASCVTQLTVSVQGQMRNRRSLHCLQRMTTIILSFAETARALDVQSENSATTRPLFKKSTSRAPPFHHPPGGAEAPATMSLAAAFDKKPGDVALVAIPAAVITSAVPPADGVGRKRSRRDMEASSAPKFNKAGNPAKKPTKDDADRVARTIFVGNVPTSMTAIQVARLFQSHLNEARKAGTLAAAPVAVEKAAGDASGDADEATPSDVADASASAADKSAEELPSTADAAESDEKDDADSVDGDAKEAGDGASAPRKRRNLTPDVESVRFRSIPVAAVAVAPGADYKTMTKAAFIRKSFADGRDAMNGACVACRCVDGEVQVGGVVHPLGFGEVVSLQRLGAWPCMAPAWQQLLSQ